MVTAVTPVAVTPLNTKNEITADRAPAARPTRRPHAIERGSERKPPRAAARAASSAISTWTAPNGSQMNPS
jgi:hypothetical protein